MAASSTFGILAASALAAPPAAAPAPGPATIVAAAGASAGAGTPLATGTAGTRFSLDLPPGAACSGDSTDGGYRVQSFMVAAAVDPASLTYGALGPLPKGVGPAFRQPLFQVNTTPFTNAATNLADRPGGQGLIINVPSFDLLALSPGDLPPQEYHLGIACTKGPASPVQLDRFWSTRLTLSAGAGSERFRWVAAAPSQPPDAGTGAPPASPAEAADAEAAEPTDRSPADEGAAPVLAGNEAGPGREAVTAATGPPEAPDEAGGASAPGGHPTFRLVAAEAVTLLSIDGNTTQSLGIWLFLALVFARMAMLLARRTAVVFPTVA